MICRDRTRHGAKKIHRSKRVAARKKKNTNQNKIKTLQKFKNAYSDFIPPNSDCNGRILGKRKPFRVKQKLFLNEKRALDAMEQSFQPRNVHKF
jgi:hypothetical protein